jgi:hypothetical protein
MIRSGQRRRVLPRAHGCASRAIASTADCGAGSATAGRCPGPPAARCAASGIGASSDTVASAASAPRPILRTRRPDERKTWSSAFTDAPCHSGGGAGAAAARCAVLIAGKGLSTTESKRPQRPSAGPLRRAARSTVTAFARIGRPRRTCRAWFSFARASRCSGESALPRSAVPRPPPAPRTESSAERGRAPLARPRLRPSGLSPRDRSARRTYSF